MGFNIDQYQLLKSKNLVTLSKTSNPDGILVELTTYDAFGDTTQDPSTISLDNVANQISALQAQIANLQMFQADAAQAQ